MTPVLRCARIPSVSGFDGKRTGADTGNRWPRDEEGGCQLRGIFLTQAVFVLKLRTGFTENEVKVAGLAGASPTEMANYLRLVTDILTRVVAALPENVTEGGKFTA